MELHEPVHVLEVQDALVHTRRPLHVLDLFLVLGLLDLVGGLTRKEL
jgi:hypothetical protein